MMASPISRVRAPDDFCFVHAADLHLDTPFKGIGQTAAHVGDALREASLGALDNLVELCIERQAAFLVIAGDVYDGTERGIRAQLRFRDGLRRLSDAGIWSFVVHGNHDPIEAGWSAVQEWPERVRVFPSDEVGAAVVGDPKSPLAIVQGISYWRRDVRDNLSSRFSRRSGSGLQVGVLHCNVSGAAEGHDDYSPCSIADLRRSGLDYWALGHIHTRMVLSGHPHGEEPWVVYPGNLQARSGKASERGAKGAMVVKVAGGRVAEAEFVACDLVRYAGVDIDVSELASLESVREACLDAARDELEAAGGRSVLLTGRFVGRADVHHQLRRPAALEEMLAAVRAECVATKPFCWWDRIDDATGSIVDLEQMATESDFSADLIELATRLLDAGPPLDAALLEELTTGLPKELRAKALDRVSDELIERGLALAVGELAAETG
jgi:exonuclease SbcD